LTDASQNLSRLRLGDVPLTLMYHSIEEVPYDPHKLALSPARFAEQMTWLAEHGMRGVGMSELLAALRIGRARGLVGLTFDDGYANVVTNVVPELRRHGFTATMFIISGLLGHTNEWEIEGTPAWQLMTAEEVQEVAAAGMEIASHSVTHPKLRAIGGERLREEVAASKSDLADLIGQPVQGFAYPYGSMDAAARQAVRDVGYDYACAVETPLGALGTAALPRILFTPEDGAIRMSAKKMFFTCYTAARGIKRELSYNPYAQRVKQTLGSIGRPKV
jgi:peptidoglycan/xylan/chitin deacetylase (PgdA/CDA1 family)